MILFTMLYMYISIDNQQSYIEDQLSFHIIYEELYLEY